MGRLKHHIREKKQRTWHVKLHSCLCRASWMQPTSTRVTFWALVSSLIHLCGVEVEPSDGQCHTGG
jgi:hypothetical protein